MIFHLTFPLLLLILTSGWETAADVTFPPVLTKQPTAEVLLVKDQGFLLECEATGNPVPNFTWLKNGEPLPDQQPRVHQIPSKGTLVFSNSKDSDIGHYQCRARNNFGMAISSSASVKKTGFTSSPKEKSVLKKVANEGEPLTLLCQPPDGIPKPNVFWVVQKGSEGRIHEINDTRLTVDPNGNLHFSNVTTSDVSRNSVYACTSTVGDLKEFKITERVIVELKAGTKKVLLYQPEQQYVSPTSVVGLRGGSVELHCIFGGTPIPDIKWKKLNGELPAGRHSFKNFGKTLILDKIEFSDNGTYGCEADNGISDPVQRAFYFNVHAAPFWIKEPNNTNAADGESVQFECRAGGIPIPSIRWLVNGSPIPEIKSTKGYSRRTLINPAVLSIVKLENTDTAVYQCIASNAYGDAISNFFINVIISAPIIVEEPQSNYTAVVAGSAVLRCRVFGAPKPQVYWLRSGLDLTGNRFSVLENGDLKIHIVYSTDAGRYQCHAANKYGTIRSDVRNGVLIVKDKTGITTVPEDHQVARGGSVTFFCNASHDRSLKLEINWLKNGQQIDLNQDWHVIRSSNNSLDVIAAQQSHTGTYTCVASTELDKTTASGTLIVQDVPNAPKITKTICTEFSVELHWQHQGDNHSPITGYNFEYNTSFDQQHWQIWTHGSRIPPTQTSTTLSMTPWANFTFRIIAYNEIGASLPSMPSNTCITAPVVPRNNPENVKGEGKTPRDLVISWSPLPLIDHYGPGLFYEVQYRLADSKYGKNNVIFVRDWRKNNVTIDNQATFQKYYIKVLAHNNIGQSRVPASEVIGYSGEDVPLQAPGNFKLQKIIDATSAEFSWSSVPASSLRGHFRGYKLQTWVSNETEIKETIIPSNLRSARIEGLPPFSKVNAQLVVFNGAYNGTPSQVITFKTPEGVPTPVQSVTVIPAGKTGLYLTWDRPQSPNGVLTGYNIYYSPTADQKRRTKPVALSIPDGKVTHFKLNMLQPNSWYKIEIRAKTKSHEGLPYVIEKKTGFDSSKPSKPDFIWYQLPIFGGKVTVRVIWLPDGYGNPGTAFYVQYKKKAKAEWLQTSVELHNVYAEIADLEPGMKYEVRLQSVDEDYATPSDVQEIETLQIESVMSHRQQALNFVDKYCSGTVRIP